MKTKILFISLITSISFAFAQSQKVDYRYAPEWHVSCISLPDDTCKTVVGPFGQMLYDFGGKNFFPYANDIGFHTVIHFLPDEGVKINSQKLYSSRVPIVQTEGTYSGMNVTQEAFALGLNYMRKGISTKLGNREDIILTKIENKTGNVQTIKPILIINSDHKVTVNDGFVTITDTTLVSSNVYISEKIVKVRKNLADFKTIIELAPVQLAAGEIRQIIVLHDNAKPSVLANQFAKDPESLLNQILDIRSEVINYWNYKTDIPYGHITIPDIEIQNLIDASLRGIWQAREIKNKNISFQVGPTCYRGLWIVDGAFLLEAATMFDRGTDARQGIDYMLSFQQKNGKFGKMSDNYWKENGIVLWTCVRHAMLTQDKEWLKSIWPKLKKTVDFIKELRVMTLQNNIKLDDGLIPPGEIDGGLWASKDKDEAEYTNIYWSLTGLKIMIQAANWIGEKKDSKDWEKEYNDFYAKFQQAAHRDMVFDSFGNKYLPVPMDPKFHSLPQRAQWAFCQGVYPGQIFEQNDPIAVGTMEMLNTTLQEGMVMGTGWIIEGIWNYFASFYGHACLWMGNGQKASKALYAFANHASPLYAWREEHNPRDLHAKYVGDMPHNWASAEFVRLAVHLLAIDRGNEMHLFEGLPIEWIQPGMVTSLKDVATPFGKLSFTLQVDKMGKNAVLNVCKLTDTSCKGIYVHLGNWGTSKESNLVKLDASKTNTLMIKMK